MTRQRALILEILQHSPKHLTADEIFAIAREKMPGIARRTVYGNLKLMEQARELPGWKCRMAPTGLIKPPTRTAICTVIAAAACRTCR